MPHKGLSRPSCYYGQRIGAAVTGHAWLNETMAFYVIPCVTSALVEAPISSWAISFGALPIRHSRLDACIEPGETQGEIPFGFLIW